VPVVQLESDMRATGMIVRNRIVHLSRNPRPLQIRLSIESVTIFDLFRRG